jgi:hypothetical protein
MVGLNGGMTCRAPRPRLGLLPQLPKEQHAEKARRRRTRATLVAMGVHPSNQPSRRNGRQHRRPSCSRDWHSGRSSIRPASDTSLTRPNTLLLLVQPQAPACSRSSRRISVGIATDNRTTIALVLQGRAVARCKPRSSVKPSAEPRGFLAKGAPLHDPLPFRSQNRTPGREEARQ